MTQAIAIEKLTLQSLKQAFDLQKTTEADFFFEWQTQLLPLTHFEADRLARIRAIYQNFEARSALENTVSLTMVSPLLDAAGLFLPPFYLETEKSVEIFANDEKTLLRGRLDVLVIKDLLWVLTIESKRAGFSLAVGIPQVLAYMLAAPTPQKTLYGMVTNGRNFIFIKLDRRHQPIYAQSEELIVDRANDLEKTLQIIKRLADIAASSGD
ncbi:MAG: restriction endonuclease subunit R [Phormidesmis priestleyi]|uniref:Restriction endonuclease subunit R n=1 Tax=Phormidesmis priestleyi TaxID=268141 RepID=A0A2W4Z5H2_9CYAN|nr:MAG: restriction endonuclease subunit R [Phormidesmis priestleyi]